MVEDVGMSLNNLRKNAFIYKPCREVGITEVSFLVTIIEFEAASFRELIIWESSH